MQKDVAIEEIRSMFITEKKVPKKEYLITTTDLINQFIKNFSNKNKYERHYIRNLFNGYLRYCRKFFREHNCNWIDPKTDKGVLHGFSKKEDLILNSLERTEKRKKNILISVKNQKEVMYSNKNQLSLFDNTN